MSGFSCRYMDTYKQALMYIRGDNYDKVGTVFSKETSDSYHEIEDQQNKVEEDGAYSVVEVRSKVISML